MVVGASGVLGKLICSELIKLIDDQMMLIITDYNQERGKKLANSIKNAQFQYLDVDDGDNVNRVIRNIDIVVVVLKQRSPRIQKLCVENKILCIDVTPFFDFAEKVIELNPIAEKNEVGSVIMSGFFPGLSGLMIKEAISGFQEVSEVNVGLLQNSNAKAGLSGVLDMLNIISQPVDLQTNSIPGFTFKRKMYFLNKVKEQEVRLIEHSEKSLIKSKLKNVPIQYWTSWNVTTFNKLISLMRRIGLIPLLLKFNKKFLTKVVKHNPNIDENAFLTVEVKGTVEKRQRVRIIAMSTHSDYHTTAKVTAALAKISLNKKVKGVLCPFEITSLEELISVIDCPDIVIQDMMN